MSMAEDAAVARASTRAVQTAGSAPPVTAMHPGAANAQLRATIEQQRNGRPQRETLHDSVLARLQARLESMPVIEQAKGILMAQQRCGPDEAFDLLRRASQRANIKIRVLAAQIVQNVASPDGRAQGSAGRDYSPCSSASPGSDCLLSRRSAGRLTRANGIGSQRVSAR
jgi:ANTAR domain